MSAAASAAARHRQWCSSTSGGRWLLACSAASRYPAPGWRGEGGGGSQCASGKCVRQGLMHARHILSCTARRTGNYSTSSARMPAGPHARWLLPQSRCAPGPGCGDSSPEQPAGSAQPPGGHQPSTSCCVTCCQAWLWPRCAASSLAAVSASPTPSCMPQVRQWAAYTCVWPAGSQRFTGMHRHVVAREGTCG